MPAELSAVLTFLVVACFGVSLYALHVRLSALASPLTEQLSKYRDALTLISARADKAETLAKETLATLANFQNAVGDKRSLEAAVSSLTSQASYLQERLTEMQRANIALANPKAEQIIAAQTFRGKETPETEVPQGPSRWQASEGTWTPPNAPWWGGKTPLVEDLSRASSTFPDYAGLAAREAGKLVPDPVETV